MPDPRYVTITVQYERELTYGRSLEWVAPELKNSALTMTEDNLDEPTPYRTWAGLVDGPTYENIAEVWRLPKDTDETNPRRTTNRITHSYVLDGMNWEAGNESPMVCVSLQVTDPP
jgi:hypothetical protein